MLTRNDHGRPAAGGTGRRRIRRLRPARWSAAFGPRGAAGPRHPWRAGRFRPSARTGGTSAARGSRGSGRRDRPVTPNLAWPPDGRAQAAQLRDGPVATASDPGTFMAQADVLTPAGEVRTRQGTFPNTGSRQAAST